MTGRTKSPLTPSRPRRWTRLVVPAIVAVLAVAAFAALYPHWAPCTKLCSVRCKGDAKRKHVSSTCPVTCQAGCLGDRFVADPLGTWDRSAKTRAGGRIIRFGDVTIVVPEVHFPLKKLLKIASELRVPLARPQTATAQRIDLRGRMASRGVRIKQQGSTPTCMAHAMSTALEYALWDTVRANPTDARRFGVRSPRVRVSRKHIHSLSLHTLGVCNRKEDYGGWALQAAGRLHSEGTFEEKYWPWRVWSPSEPRWRTCEEAMNGGTPSSNALAHRHFFLDEYHYLPPFSFHGSAYARQPSHLEGVLAQGKPIVFGVLLITSSFQAATRNGGLVRVPRHPDKAKPDGGHYVVLVGYDRRRKWFTFANSWGTRFGTAGYGRMTYDYVKRYAIEGLYIDKMALK